MIKRKTILAYIIIILTLFVDSTYAAPPVEQMQNSTVLVVCQLSQNEGELGSGFVINPTDVVTNWHVVNCSARGGRIVIFTDIHKKFSGKVKWHSKSKDLAVVETETPLNKPSVEIARSDTAKVTDTVFASGFPGGHFNFLDVASFFTVKLTKGTLTAKVRTREGVALFQIDAPINPGNSGGPLFNEKGHLIGINWAKEQAVVITINPDGKLSPMRVPSAEGVGWSIQADELIKELRALDIPFKEAGVLQPSPPATKVKEAPDLKSPQPALPAYNDTSKFLWFIAGFIVTGLVLLLVVLIKRNKKINVLSKENKDKKPVLVAISGDMKGAKIEFDTTPVIIGRDPTVCNLIIPQKEDTISKRHCTVRYDFLSGKFYIIDHSRNGTFLEGGARISNKGEVSISPGQRFYLSRKNIMFEVRVE